MTFQGIDRPAFTTSERERRFPIDELDVVTLVSEVRTEDGEVVPAGTAGTVVAVWGDAEAFDLEFDAPFTGLATVDRAMVQDTRQR